MSKIEKIADIRSRYDKGRLFLGSYGYVFYLPKVDLLNQLSLNLDSLRVKQEEMAKEKRKRRKGGGGDHFEFHDLKIKVPVPPPPAEAMRNPHTKERFPLGTRVDPETGEGLEEIESVLEERTVQNQIIYTNVDHGSVYYIDATGALATYNVGHVATLVENPNAVLHILDAKIKVKGSFPQGEIRHKWNQHDLENMFFVDPKDSSPRAKAHRERLQSMSGVDFTKEGGVPLFMYSRNRDFKLFVEAELAAIERTIHEGRATVKSKQLGAYYAKLITAVLFADQHSAFFADMLSQEEQSSGIDPTDAPEIPHVREDTRYLPHQAYGLAFLKDKQAAMVDADPGAGKTLIMLSDILDKLNRGLVKRPCLVMPNSLLSQQKAELEEWTRGTVNFVVINTDTAKEADPAAISERTGLPRKNVGSAWKGLQEIKKLLQGAPINTIILTSYAWIRGGQKDQMQTGSGLHFRRASWLTTWAGIDMLVLDESHNVRVGSSGKQSKKAQAIMQMARLVSWKRCYTGTTAPSGPDDIFLQMNFLDPSVLGDRKSFIEKYSASTSSGKRKRNRIEMFAPGAIKEIRSKISRRVGLSVRRSAWLSQLPQLDVNYHQANLTKPQELVYLRIMDRILEEELGNLDPGTAGRALQSQLRDDYASNPVARAKINSWEGPTSIEVIKYDENEDEHIKVTYDLGDEAKQKTFEVERNRAIKNWEQYQELPAEQVVGAEDFLPLLQKFIAFDRFLNNPVSDEFGQHFLVDEADLVSPKVKVIDNVLAGHFANPANGKVIIFTQYKDVAAHLLDNIQMSSSAVYYDSGRQKNLEAFKKDDSVRILIAVEQSIREGQNLQMANRIIRVDMPWNPGDYEQAIARAYRLPPKDPTAQRYSVVHVDIILTEGTAEITKFMRMVSKLHKVRQLISGYADDRPFPLVGMNLDNMRVANTFQKMEVYKNVYASIRDQEIEEAKKAPDLFGTDSFTLATGEKMEGSEHIETPTVASDVDRSPESIDPAEYDPSKLIRPVFVYFNNAFWMALRMDARMGAILRGFQAEPKTEFLYRAFGSQEEAFDILKALQANKDAPLRVVNVSELVPKVMGRIPVDPTFPDSIIEYGKLVKKGNAPPPDFRPTSDTYARDILGYQPSQRDFKFSLSVLRLAAKGKPIAPLHGLAAAKLFGYFNLDVKDLDPAWLWKNSRHFAMIRRHKGILQQQLEQTATPARPATPSQNEVTVEQEDTEIPGLDAPVTSEGIPIQLQVSILGAIRADSVQQQPCFTISDTSGFTAPGFADKIIAILKDHGFRSWPSGQQWLFMGNTRAEAAKGIKNFSNRMFRWYFLEDPDHFGAQIAKFGLSLEDIWPKQQLLAMRKVASIREEYPEYQGVIDCVYVDV